MRVRKIIDSFNYAISGLIHSLKTQRNMRIHLAVAFLVLVLSNFFTLNRLELILLFFAISLVLVAEMINTAIETSIDLFTDKYHPLAKIAKNVAAGAVLIASVNSLLVAYFIFFDKLDRLIPFTVERVRNSPIHLSFIALILITIVIISIKAYLGAKHFVRGGFPSGHSAIAFGSATVILLTTKEILPTTLAFLVALLVAESRVEGRIHSTLEVILGALIGVIIVVLIFQLGM
jgi:diacylglycerol kinase (ATP)